MIIENLNATPEHFNEKFNSNYLRTFYVIRNFYIISGNCLTVLRANFQRIKVMKNNENLCKRNMLEKLYSYIVENLCPCIKDNTTERRGNLSSIKACRFRELNWFLRDLDVAVPRAKSRAMRHNNYSPSFATNFAEWKFARG